MEAGMLRDIKQIVQDEGFAVLIETEFCKKHAEKHDNCDGCESTAGCCRYVSIAMLNANAIVYAMTKTNDFETFKKVQKDVIMKMKQILNPELTTDQIVELV